MEVPKLSLSHGQALWAVSHGSPASQPVIDQVRRLRQLGIPFGTDDLGIGRGSRAKYRFDHLIELGLALFGLRRGLKPTEVAAILIKNRSHLRRLFRQILQEQTEEALGAEWVKSRGRIIPLLADEVFVRLHDRYSEQPGKLEVLGPGETNNPSVLFGLAEHYPGDRARTLVPLTRLVLELIAWAKEAPETRPGPK
jgi:hypothetical protein